MWSVLSMSTMPPKDRVMRWSVRRALSPPQPHPGEPSGPYLLGGEILHASGHLIGARYQVLGGQLLLRVVAGVVAVLQPRRPPGLQVLP